MDEIKVGVSFKEVQVTNAIITLYFKGKFCISMPYLFGKRQEFGMHI
jgi:hypothetical protein